MDKRTIFAFVLIGLVFMAWSFFNAVNTPPPVPATADTQTVAGAAPPVGAPEPPAPDDPSLDTAAPVQLKGAMQGTEEYYVIETPLYKASINTRGGTLARIELKKYNAWYGAPVQLINDSTGFPGVLGVRLRASDGSVVPTDRLFYTIAGDKKRVLGKNDSIVVVARLAVSVRDSTDTSDVSYDTTGALVEKRFVFRGDAYAIGLDVKVDTSSVLASGGYDLTWKRGLEYQEHSSVEESSRAKVMALAGEEMVEFDHSELGVGRDTIPGPITWVGQHIKYFVAAIIPSEPIAAPVIAEGRTRSADSSGIVESYSISLRIPKSIAGAQSFTVFAGPLDYSIIDDYGLTAMVDLGLRFVIRPIAEYVLLPALRFLHSFIGNYGLVIIVFSLLIRLLLWPLSVPQIRSSRKMQLLQPKVAELREKFKDDSQRQQMETMGLYREYGINPVGGCLPMILQMPILYALWGVLSSSIELRQAGFALWITDLSVPDQVINLPFSIPLLGDKLSGLALIMGVTLFIQQKMMLTDPKQKMLVYFMPIFLTLAFNHLPSGLNLYYLTFNILSIAQQVYMTKYAKNTMTLEQMKATAKGKKKGWLATKMEEAQKLAAQQQKMSGKVDGRTAVEPRKKK